jgi:ABC-2 type transport system permease protein
MRAMFQTYRALMRAGILAEFQYPIAQYFYMIGMITEPVVYLVVWGIVAQAQGGQVGGYTPAQFAAYYIIWMLVRTMNVTFTPYGWEWRIREGRLSTLLSRPLHPIHNDIAYFLGMKVPNILLWLPVAFGLVWAFKPDLHPNLWQVLGFGAALLGAFLLRTMLLWSIGLITFWTTRVAAIFELYFMLELLLSGRMVPLSLMPNWVQQIAVWLPFRWAFQFPIELLVFPTAPSAILQGLAIQLLWIVAGALLVRLIWRQAVRHYGAVGG